MNRGNIDLMSIMGFADDAGVFLSNVAFVTHFALPTSFMKELTKQQQAFENLNFAKSFFTKRKHRNDLCLLLRVVTWLTCGGVSPGEPSP